MKIVRDKQYYIDKYNELYDECLIETGAEDSNDVTSGADQLFGEYANAEAIAGYYLTFYESDALNQWMINTKDINLTEQDKDVTSILEDLEKFKDVEHNVTTETIYLTDITGTIGQWLDMGFDDEVSQEVVALLGKVYMAASLELNKVPRVFTKNDETLSVDVRISNATSQCEMLNKNNKVLQKDIER